MNKEILKLAIPNIISNISIPLLSTVDTALMGHLSSIELGAVGISSMIFNFVYWNFGFLRMGTTGMTAQAYGRKDNLEISNNLQRAFYLSLFISIIIIVFMVPIGRISAYLMNVQLVQESAVFDYFYIRVWAAPATLGLYALMGWFFGLQNAKIPLIITVLVNIVNIVLSYYLVYVSQLGIKGVAIGTVIAQYFGLLFSLIVIYFYFKKYLIVIPFNNLFGWRNLSRFLNINKDIFFRTVCLSFAFAFLYSQASLKGELFLATNVLLLQFLNWTSYAIDGFAHSAESLIGKYFGAKDEANTFKAIKYIFIWGFSLSLMFSTCFFFFGDNIVRIFTNQFDVIQESNKLINWVIVLPVVAFSCYLWDGIFIGLTASKAMRNTMIAAVIIYLLSYYGFPGNNIWLALMVFLGARGVLQTIVFAQKKLKLN